MQERTERVYVLDSSAAEIQGICEKLKKIRREKMGTAVVTNVTYRQWRNIQRTESGNENLLNVIDDLFMLNKKGYYIIEKMEETEKDYEEDLTEFCHKKVQSGCEVFLLTTNEATRAYAQMYSSFQVLYFESEKQFVERTAELRCARFLRGKLFVDYNIKKSDVEVISKGKRYFNPLGRQLHVGDEIILFTIFHENKNCGNLYHFKVKQIARENNSECIAKKLVVLRDKLYLNLESQYVHFIEECIENRI